MEKQIKHSTIWFGNLDGFEDEEYFKMIFKPFYEIISIKIINSNNKSDYAFIEFKDK